MKDQDKDKQQLIDELVLLRQQLPAGEQALLESQASANLLQIAPLGIHECDTEGRITFVNPSQEAITGYTAEELLGSYVWDRIVPGPDKDSLPAYFKHLVSEQPPPTPFMSKNIRKNGEWFDVRIDWNYKRDLQGQVTGFVCIVSDITEQKSAEEARNKYSEELERRVQERTAEVTKANQELQREIEERKRVQDELQVIHDNMVDGLLIGECSTGRLLRTNPSMCRMLAYSEEELLSLSVADVHPPETASMVLDKFQTQQDGQRMVTQNRPMLRKDGSVFYADISNVRVSYLGQPCIIGIFRDITKRKAAEEALQEAHDELRAIYEGLRDGVLIADSQTHRFIQTNGAMCKMLGYSEEEVLTLSVEEIHPNENVSDVLDKFRLNSEGLLRIAEDTPVLRRDGTVFYADIATNRLTYRGRPCVIGFFRDVTERHKSQEALKRERRTLTHMLRASDHERQLIAYDIHDGLAQQLAGAIMQFEIYDQFKDSDPTEAKKAYDGGVTLLRRGHTEARRLISGVRPPILDESGVMAAISHLVHDPAFDQGPSIEFRSRVSFSRLEPVIENVIYRIVQEGLSNARSHSGSNQVVVSLLQRDARLRIRIQDWGVGFKPEGSLRESLRPRRYPGTSETSRWQVPDQKQARQWNIYCRGTTHRVEGTRRQVATCCPTRRSSKVVSCKAD